MIQYVYNTSVCSLTDPVLLHTEALCLNDRCLNTNNTIFIKMKKFTVLSVMLVCLLATSVSAQEMKLFNWTTYKTQFEIPSNFVVQKNDITEFTAGTEEIVLTVYPRKGEEVDFENMPAALADWATENKLENLGEITELDGEQLKGYWGVFQEGTYNGLPVIVMLIVDPDYSDIGFYIWLNYTEGNEDVCVKILKSFTPIE